MIFVEKLVVMQNLGLAVHLVLSVWELQEYGKLQCVKKVFLQLSSLQQKLTSEKSCQDVSTQLACNIVFTLYITSLQKKSIVSDGIQFLVRMPRRCDSLSKENQIVHC